MEIEAKFCVPDMETFNRLRRADHLAGFTLSARQVKRVHDTYLDTQDRLVTSGGYACRRRQQAEGVLMTLKRLRDAEGAIHRREELEVQMPAYQPPAAWPASPLRDRVLGLIGESPLIPLFSLQQVRLVRRVSQGDRQVAELSLDGVHLAADNRELSFLEAEVELGAQGDEEDLAALVACLQNEWYLEPETRSKFERALEFCKEPAATEDRQFNAAQTSPVKPPKQPGLEAEDSMAEAARKTFYFHFQRMLYHEPGTRSGEDIEELHDMRVATRRMRAAFRVFGNYLDMERWGPIIKGLRRTGRILGAVRDLDVFWEKTQHYLDALPPEQPVDLGPLRAVWEVQRKTARERMLDYLDSGRYVRFKNEFGEFLQSPGAGALPVISPQGEPLPHRLGHVVPVAVYQGLAVVRAYDEWVTQPDAPLERFHQLRIAAKGLRYTLEFFREVLGPEANTSIDEIKAVQDHLGDLQDAVVASQLLRDFLTWGTWGRGQPDTKRAPAPVKPVIAPGVATYLAARQAELQHLLQTFPQIWARVQSPEFSQSVVAAVSPLLR